MSARPADCRIVFSTGGPCGDEAMVTPDSYPEVAQGNKYHLYAPALRCFPSKALKEFIAAHLIATNLRDYVDDIRYGRQFDFSAMKNIGFVQRRMRIIANEMDRDPDGFELGPAEWVRKRATMPDRPEQIRHDDAVHENIGVLSTQPRLPSHHHRG